MSVLERILIYKKDAEAMVGGGYRASGGGEYCAAERGRGL